jgi:hypothetical protein
MRSANLDPSPRCMRSVVSSLLQAPWCKGPSVNLPRVRPARISMTFLAACLGLLGVPDGAAQVPAPARIWMPFSHVGAGANIGTTGLAVEVAAPYGAYWNIRVGVSYLACTRTFHNGGAPFEGNVRLGGARAGIDWFPTAGGFHISLGVLVPNLTQTSARIALQPGKSITIEGTQYTTDVAHPFRGSAHSEISPIAPLLAVGWGNLIPRNYHKRLTFPIEIGAIYEGPPTVHATNAGDICTSDGGCRPSSIDPEFNQNLATALGDVNSSLDRYARLFPIISAGVGYRF